MGLHLPLLAFNSSHVLSQKEQDGFLNPRLALEHPASRPGMNWVTSQSPVNLSAMRFQERTKPEDRHWLGAGTEGWCDSLSGTSLSLTSYFVRPRHKGLCLPGGGGQTEHVAANNARGQDEEKLLEPFPSAIKKQQAFPSCLCPPNTSEVPSCTSESSP